jgi:hypothetical protein
MHIGMEHVFDKQLPISNYKHIKQQDHMKQIKQHKYSKDIYWTNIDMIT